MGKTNRAARKAGGGAQPKAQFATKAVFETTKKKEVGVSDLTLISKVSNEAINENLKKRFENGEIYTYIGHVLVSVNPFRDLGIYTEQVLESYKGKNRLEVRGKGVSHQYAELMRNRYLPTYSQSPSPPTTI
jgi:myosin-1